VIFIFIGVKMRKFEAMEFVNRYPSMRRMVKEIYAENAILGLSKMLYKLKHYKNMVHYVCNIFNDNFVCLSLYRLLNLLWLMDMEVLSIERLEIFYHYAIYND